MVIKTNTKNQYTNTPTQKTGMTKEEFDRVSEKGRELHAARKAQEASSANSGAIGSGATNVGGTNQPTPSGATVPSGASQQNSTVGSTMGAGASGLIPGTGNIRGTTGQPVSLKPAENLGQQSVDKTPGASLFYNSDGSLGLENVDILTREYGIGKDEAVARIDEINRDIATGKLDNQHKVQAYLRSIQDNERVLQQGMSFIENADEVSIEYGRLTNRVEQLKNMVATGADETGRVLSSHEMKMAQADLTDAERNLKRFEDNIGNYVEFTDKGMISTGMAQFDHALQDAKKNLQRVVDDKNMYSERLKHNVQNTIDLLGRYHGLFKLGGWDNMVGGISRDAHDFLDRIERLQWDYDTNNEDIMLEASRAIEDLNTYYERVADEFEIAMEDKKKEILLSIVRIQNDAALSDDAVTTSLRALQGNFNNFMAGAVNAWMEGLHAAQNQAIAIEKHNSEMKQAAQAAYAGTYNNMMEHDAFLLKNSSMQTLTDMYMRGELDDTTFTQLVDSIKNIGRSMLEEYYGVGPEHIGYYNALIGSGMTPNNAVHTIVEQAGLQKLANVKVESEIEKTVAETDEKYANIEEIKQNILKSRAERDKTVAETAKTKAEEKKTLQEIEEKNYEQIMADGGFLLQNYTVNDIQGLYDDGKIGASTMNSMKAGLLNTAKEYLNAGYEGVNGEVEATLWSLMGEGFQDEDGISHQFTYAEAINAVAEMYGLNPKIATSDGALYSQTAKGYNEDMKALYMGGDKELVNSYIAGLEKAGYADATSEFAAQRAGFFIDNPEDVIGGKVPETMRQIQIALAGIDGFSGIENLGYKAIGQWFSGITKDLWSGSAAKRKAAEAALEFLTGNETLEYLIDVKERGATFGALNQSELDMLTVSATIVGNKSLPIASRVEELGRMFERYDDLIKSTMYSSLVGKVKKGQEPFTEKRVKAYFKKMYGNEVDANGALLGFVSDYLPNRAESDGLSEMLGLYSGSASEGKDLSGMWEAAKNLVDERRPVDNRSNIKKAEDYVDEKVKSFSEKNPTVTWGVKSLADATLGTVIPGYRELKAVGNIDKLFSGKK